MTKEEVLQKVNDYCSEKSYTNETLTDDYKSQFSDFFSKKYPAETSIDAEGVFDDIKFNLNSAFSAASKGITEKQKVFAEKESDYKRQIEEAKKNGGEEPKKVELPDDLKGILAELESFKNEAKKTEKFKEILSLAKKSVRSDLHKSLENYASDFAVTLDETSENQAKKLTSRFQEIFKDSIGDVKPLAPKQSQKRDEEYLASIPKVKI